MLQVTPVTLILAPVKLAEALPLIKNSNRSVQMVLIVLMVFFVFK
jgi:hypothetical protein